MTFQSTAGFLQWFVLYKLLAFSYEISPKGQVLLGGSMACPAPAELVGTVAREPLGLPAHISCVGSHSPISVVLHILKYLLLHFVSGTWVTPSLFFHLQHSLQQLCCNTAQCCFVQSSFLMPFGNGVIPFWIGSGDGRA